MEFYQMTILAWIADFIHPIGMEQSQLTLLHVHWMIVDFIPYLLDGRNLQIKLSSNLIKYTNMNLKDYYYKGIQSNLTTQS